MATTKEIIIHATGRRKSAIARVTLSAGKGDVKLNWIWPNKDAKAYALSPLELIGAQNKYNIKINLAGGGIVSRLDAIRLGVARALIAIDEENKTTLRKAGFLTRDSREKERKKPGLRRARRAPQWAKR
jgi:small subunit ribosomal protein S9